MSDFVKIFSSILYPLVVERLLRLLIGRHICHTEALVRRKFCYACDPKTSRNCIGMVCTACIENYWSAYYFFGKEAVVLAL